MTVLLYPFQHSQRESGCSLLSSSLSSMLQLHVFQDGIFSNSLLHSTQNVSRLFSKNWDLLFISHILNVLYIFLIVYIHIYLFYFTAISRTKATHDSVKEKHLSQGRCATSIVCNNLYFFNGYTTVL